MASLFKRGKMWGIDYCTPNGKRVRKSVSRYKETAQKVLKKIEIEMVEGKYLDIQRHEPISFEDFAEKFRRRHIRRRNKSAKNQEYLLNQLVKYFGKRMMHEISTNDIEELLDKRHQQNCAASTINKDLTMLKSMFNRAKEWGDLNKYNPVRDIKKLKEDNERCRYLTEEEQERLLAVCSGSLRMIVLIALRVGLRWGEIVSLKWKPAPKSNFIDFKNNVAFIHESLSKSGKSRHVPLALSIKQALMDYPQASESGYIFVNPKTGRPIVTLKKSFKTAVKKAGIGDFRLHDLRHCFASDLVCNGADLFTVQKLLGHSSPKMTQRYAHLGHNHLNEAIQSLDKKRDQKLEFSHNFVAQAPTIPSREKQLL